MGRMLEGGCHCGRVRLAIAGDDVLGTGYCHCSICRRLSGGPVNAWVAVAPDRLQVTGEPRLYRSSATGRRAFCPDCGAQLWFAPDDGSFVTVNATGFDDPEAEPLRPAMHIFTADQLCWFDVKDQLPRLPAGPPDSAG